MYLYHQRTLELLTQQPLKLVLPTLQKVRLQKAKQIRLKHQNRLQEQMLISTQLLLLIPRHQVATNSRL